MTGQSISLVLGSGGARGLAHIGAIQCLEAEGHEIRYISGSSMGALVGGIHAAGKLEHLKSVWQAAILPKVDPARIVEQAERARDTGCGGEIADIVSAAREGACDLDRLAVEGERAVKLGIARITVEPRDVGIPCQSLAQPRVAGIGDHLGL